MLLWIPLWAALGWAQDDQNDEDPREKDRAEIDFDSIDISGQLLKPSASLLMSSANISATPGGAQDLHYFDRLLEIGRVPAEVEFTAEGLLSEYDLPSQGKVRCQRLLCAETQSMTVTLPADPAVTHLAQLGFQSRLTTIPLPPLNLTVVIDVSGSMQGQPLASAKAALRALTRQLNPQDQIAIVAFNDTVWTELPPTPADKRPVIDAAIERLFSSGSTALSDGLEQGFTVARQSRASFDGTSRVVLFTDEQPNVGDTSARGFQGQLSHASRDGVGLTTIGVGVNFGAQLAQTVSASRGANLFYVSTVEEGEALFSRPLGELFVPLAHDLTISVRPAKGAKLEAVYGLPGEMIRWAEDGSFSMHLSTLFPSRQGGGIFLGFSGAGGGSLGTVTIDYDPLDGPQTAHTDDIEVVNLRRAWTGLRRGAALIDAYTTYKQVSERYHANGDSAKTRELAVGLVERLNANGDRALDEERERAAKLASVLAAPAVSDNRSEVAP